MEYLYHLLEENFLLEFVVGFLCILNCPVGAGIIFPLLLFFRCFLELISFTLLTCFFSFFFKYFYRSFCFISNGIIFHCFSSSLIILLFLQSTLFFSFSHNQLGLLFNKATFSNTNLGFSAFKNFLLTQSWL